MAAIPTSAGAAIAQENIDIYLPHCLDPVSLQDFGYAYQPDGTLRHIATQTPFKFLSQKHYDLLGNAVVEEIYRMMESSEMNLRRHPFPLDADLASEPSCPIFASANAEECETVMLLCQGSGAVRPGMWARALCMNNTLDRGTVFPYIRDAQSRGWGVLVLNPNENLGAVPTGNGAANANEGDAPPAVATSSSATADGIDAIRAAWVDVSKEEWAAKSRAERAAMQWIRDSDAPEVHMISAYNNVLPALFPNMKRLLIVAHSYGGKCVTALVRSVIVQSNDEGKSARFHSLVPAIALTDAINDLKRQDRKTVKSFMQQRTINWIASSKHLDASMPIGPEKSLELSSGHTDHVHTSESCRTSVMSLFDEVCRAIPVGKEDISVVAKHCAKLSSAARRNEVNTSECC
ncbi:Hypothetical protein, putative [Bodo saltans]|uniref:Arb2 domain-containing protein n=1 Tax=Bodo saltans TaxID=75058 RepID=A0A0S4KGE0_BODSA|nr:Hypothetical protein, putative [Bodo saltans]|eukprot:CUI14196.1 Hypothetical protein, putative [Bodo saltans]